MIKGITEELKDDVIYKVEDGILHAGLYEITVSTIESFTIRKQNLRILSNETSSLLREWKSHFSILVETTGGNFVTLHFYEQKKFNKMVGWFRDLKVHLIDTQMKYQVLKE